MAIALGAARSDAAPTQPAASRDKVPITTASDEARALYVQARDLLEKLRITDARKLFEAAVAKDKDFALGHLGLANTAPSNHDFFAALDHAVALADKASEPERLMIALAESRPKVAAAELAQANQQDPRVLYLLAVALTGAGDAAKAKATAGKAVSFNGLSFNYGYVLAKAKGLLKT